VKLGAALATIVVVIVIITTSACSQPDTTIDRVFDPCSPLALELVDATDAQRASTGEGIAMWNTLLGAQLTLDEQSDAPRVPVHFDDAGANFHGYYDDERGIVYINNDIADDRARAITLAHELGHAFGLLHEEERVSVMNSGNQKIEPNEGDEDALVRLWGQCN
jgi:hypothetical protein